jgi:hypothetical protein
VIPLVLYSIFFVVVVAGSCRLRCHSMCHCYMYPLIFRFTSDFWAKDSTTTGISVANVNTSSCCYSTFMMGLPQKINIIRNRQFPRSFTLLVRHRSTSPLCFHPHCLNLLDEVLGALPIYSMISTSNGLSVFPSFPSATPCQRQTPLQCPCISL